jgi:thioredoxin-related protein
MLLFATSFLSLLLPQNKNSMKCYYSTHRFLFFFLFLIAPVLLKAQPKPLGIDIEDSWEEAKIKAAQQGKFIFVDFTAPYCGGCKKMEKEVFTKLDIIDIFNKSFIFLRISDEGLEMPENQEVVNNIQPAILPATVFYKPNARFIDSHIGSQTYEEFLNRILQVVNNSNPQVVNNSNPQVVNNSNPQDLAEIEPPRNVSPPDNPSVIITKGTRAPPNPPTPAIPKVEAPKFNPPVQAPPPAPAPAPPPAKKTLTAEEEAFENLVAKLNSGNYTLDDLKNYAYMAKSFQKPYQHVADLYLVNAQDKLSDENMQFIVDFANTTTARATKLMVDNIAKFKEKYSSKINSRISETLRNSVRNAPESEKKLVLEQALDIIDKAKLPDGGLLSFELKGMYYQGTKNWREYTKLCKKYIEQFDISEHVLLNNIATTYAENVNDPELLKQALLWAKKSVAIEPHYDNYQTCAILHIRLNDMDNANICKTQCLQLAATELDERIAKEIINDIVKKLDELISEQ